MLRLFDHSRLLLVGAGMALLASCASTPENPPPVPGPSGPSVSSLLMVQPVQFVKISSPFGPRHGRLHQGIDFAAPEGTKIIAAKAGVVVFAGSQRGYGHKIIIRHDHGLSTVYAHMRKIDVRVGQRVVAGQRIGDVGHSGNATGPNLHFETRVNDKPVNPIVYLPPL